LRGCPKIGEKGKTALTLKKNRWLLHMRRFVLTSRERKKKRI